MSAIFISVLKLFIIISIGFVIRKTGVINEYITKGFSSLLIKVTLPALIFVSMQKDFTPELLRESYIITALSFGVYALYFIIAFITGKFIRANGVDRGVYQFAILFSNVGFMGFPVLGSVYGEDSIFYAAMFNIPFHFFVFTAGVYFVTRGQMEGKKLDFKLMLSPGIVATILGFIFFVSGIKLPPIIYEPAKMTGDITIPLSMITVGSMLTEIHYRELLAGWRVYFISGMRLILLPALVFLFVTLFTDNEMIISVAVVIAAMPVAVNAPLIAQEYGGNSLLASRLVFLSTLLSLMTLPMVLVVLKVLV